MPKLGEVIGAFLADAAQARVRADLEAVRIAETYSQHDLLKHLPVPRFRLPELVVDLPVLVLAIEDRSENGGKVFGQPTTTEITQTIRDALKESGLHFPRNASTKAVAAAVERAKELFGTNSSLTDPDRITRDLTEAVVASVREVTTGDITAEQVKKLDNTLEISIRKLLSAKVLPSRDVQVLVSASEIKAHADNDSVVRVRLTITEEAYEVVTRDDGPGYYLTPE